MIRNRIRRNISFSVPVFISIMLVSLLCCGILYISVIHYSKQHMMDSQSVSLHDYISHLANQMNITGYMTITNQDIDNELSSICDVNDSRILVVNNYHTVVYDSFDKDTGVTLLSGNIASCLSGKEFYVIDYELDRARFYFPVIPSDKSEPIGGVLVVAGISGSLLQIKELQQLMAVICSLILIIVFIFALIFSIHLSKPFRKLNQSITNVCNGTSVSISSAEENKEAYRLSESTNHMLMQGIKLEESRQQFVSNVSHELKTPLTSMKVLAESLLMMPNAPEEMVREFLNDINNEITRENAIISDLLTLVSFDKSTNVLHTERKNINDLVEIIMKRVRPIAETRSIEMVLESYRSVYANVDESKMIVALSDIIENAVKYNKDNGYIHVTVNSDIHYCYITIEDSGIGMIEEEVPHIFDRFYRIDKARSRETGGTGLGLSIAKEIITMHGGTIKVYSKVNIGTTFTIRLPLNSGTQPVRKEGDL